MQRYSDDDVTFEEEKWLKGNGDRTIVHAHTAFYQPHIPSFPFISRTNIFCEALLVGASTDNGTKMFLFHLEVKRYKVGMATIGMGPS